MKKASLTIEFNEVENPFNEVMKGFFGAIGLQARAGEGSIKMNGDQDFLIFGLVKLMEGHKELAFPLTTAVLLFLKQMPQAFPELFQEMQTVIEKSAIPKTMDEYSQSIKNIKTVLQGAWDK